MVFYAGCEAQKPSLPPSLFFWGFVLEGFPITEKQLTTLQQKTNLPIQLISFFLMWPHLTTQQTPIDLLSSLDTIGKWGAIPCITWEPCYLVMKDTVTISYTDIMEGKYDPYIELFSKAIKTYGQTVIIRFAHEMNLNTYHWGTSSHKYGPDSPGIYIKMFRYIVKAFNNHGVNNVLWAFCPNANSVPDYQWNQSSEYYPGDDFVDILGMDGYNWGGKDHEATDISFEQIFSPLYLTLKKIARDKPVMVFETAAEDSQKEWLLEALKVSKRWDLKGISWFQVDKEKKWSMEEPSKEGITFIREWTTPTQRWLMQGKTP
jgi:mannan endo-1,4-beta-mannosidase